METSPCRAFLARRQTISAGAKPRSQVTGTYLGQQIAPKSRDTYIGLKGAVLDGQSTAVYAFYGSATNVTVENLVIRDYANPSQRAALAPQTNGTGWMIKNNEIADNGAAGVAAQSGSSVIANYIHNNNEEGYTVHGVGATFTDNEISYNNPNDIFSPIAIRFQEFSEPCVVSAKASQCDLEIIRCLPFTSGKASLLQLNTGRMVAVQISSSYSSGNRSVGG
jgi:hypothetical protein